MGMAEIDIVMAVARLREAAGAVPLIAYGSHVDKARLDEAQGRRLRRGHAQEQVQRRVACLAPALLRWQQRKLMKTDKELYTIFEEGD